MKTFRLRGYFSHFIPALLVLSGTLAVHAQIPMASEKFDRRQRAEVYGLGQYLHSDTINWNGPTGNVPLKMDDTGLGGFGFAFHFSDYFSVHSDFMFGEATFNGNLPLQGGGTFYRSQDAFIQTGRFNIDYNIINRRITPFLTAGLGYQYLETELHNAPPVGYCWWDPFYGYVCYYDHPVAWRTDFTWNAGGGVRWDITDHLFIKVTGGATWLEYSGSHGITTQLEGIFAIGWTF
jgi:opacity protein-like surface antigen